MNRVPSVVFALLFAGAAYWASASAAEPEKKTFRAGAATSNITPPLGSPVAGAGSTVPTNNVHDELHPRALVLDDGNTRFALVVCDSSGISVSICNKAREFIAAIPYETFAETGLQIKKESPFQDTFTIELANGAGGYLPTPAQYKLGGYETWFGTNRVQLDASERITGAIQAMMKELKVE